MNEPATTPRRAGPAELHARAVVKCLLNYRGERRSILRGYVFDLARSISPSIAVEASGIRYYVSTADREISRQTYIRGEYEQDKLVTAVDLIESRTALRLKGMQLIEVGANIGTTTIPAVKVFGAEHVWAFEPAPNNLRLLKCNVIANDLEASVTVIPIALSDNSGVTTLEIAQDHWGDNRVTGGDADGYYDEAHRPRIQVQVARFDDAADLHGIDMRKVGLVWMDTQGHEGRVLAGATRITVSDIPVLVEYWPYGLRRSASLDLFHNLVARNYSTIIDIGGSEPREYPADRVADLERKYDGVAFTDLLLL